MRSALVSVAIALAGAADSAPAQTNPWDIPKPGTYQGSVELQKRQQQEEAQRRQQNPGNAPPGHSPASGTSVAGTQAASKAAYDLWDKRPALVVERNPLLGRWSWQSGAARSDMTSMLDGKFANAVGCSMLFGDGAVEFRPSTFVNIQGGREQPIGNVVYRGGGRQVIALQRDGVKLFMQFDFQAPDRISLSGVPCVMNRVGAAAAAPTAAAASTARSATPASSPGFEVLGVTLGHSNDREVRNNIAARGARPLIGRTPGSQELRIEVHDRKYGHPLLANVWYDFDDGVLSAVTIIWERDRAAAPVLFRQRADFLRLTLGLGPPQQTSKLTGQAKGVEVVLVDDAAGGLVSERYAMPR